MLVRTYACYCTCGLSTARTTMQRALTSFYSVEAVDDTHVESPWRTCSRTDIFGVLVSLSLVLQYYQELTRVKLMLS